MHPLQPPPIASILVLEPLLLPIPLLSGIYDLVPFLDRFEINVECKGSTDTEGTRQSTSHFLPGFQRWKKNTLVERRLCQGNLPPRPSFSFESWISAGQDER